MKIVEKKCKNCGAFLKVDMDLKEMVCPFCGSEYIMDDEIKHVKYENMEQSGYEFEMGRLRAQQESIPKPKKKITLGRVLLWFIFLPFILIYYIVKSIIFIVRKAKKDS